MKRMIYSLASMFLLTPIPTLSMTVAPSQPESLEDKFKKEFAKKVAAITKKKTELYFRAPPSHTSDSESQRLRASSYTPNADQEWEIVVAD